MKKENLEKKTDCPVEKWCSTQDCSGDQDYEICPTYRNLIRSTFPYFSEYQERILSARRFIF